MKKKNIWIIKLNWNTPFLVQIEEVVKTTWSDERKKDARRDLEESIIRQDRKIEE